MAEVELTIHIIFEHPSQISVKSETELTHHRSHSDLRWRMTESAHHRRTSQSNSGKIGN